MGAIPVVVLLVVASGAALFVLMRGDRTWLDEPAPEPPAPDEVEVDEVGEVTRAGVPADEPSMLTAPPEPDVGEAEPADVFVLAPMEEPLPEPVAEPVQTRGRARRRPRFEEVASLTLPDIVDAGGVQVAAISAGPIPEKVPVHIPFTTRLFGAVRLVLLVAVSAAAVAAAVVGAGYVLMEKLLGGG